MKKTLNVILSAALALGMLTSTAYITGPEKADESQLALAAVRAVDIQTAIGGIRSYADIVDTTHVYQVNDPIYVAVTVEVRNLEKTEYMKLKSIEDKKIDVIVGGSHVDFSYAKYNTPMLLSHIYSGINEANVATFANVFNAANLLSYDKEKNEVKLTFKGYQMNSSSLNTNGTFNVSAVPDKDGSSIAIPALRLRDGKTTISFGTQNYTYDYKSPGSMAYTAVVMGVCKDNAGAQKGDFYARILISGAEKFELYKHYYVGANMDILADTAITGLKEYVDYVKVNVYRLKIAGGYNVYKYVVPSNAMIHTDIPIQYDLNGDNEKYRGELLAYVNPNKFDNATNKTDKWMGVTGLRTAGAVRTVKAYTKFDASGNPTGSMEDVPLTGVLYTSKYTIYAPSFYGIVGKDDGDRYIISQEGGDKAAKNVNVTMTQERVEYWYNEVDLVANSTTDVRVYVYDAGKLAASAPLIGGAPTTIGTATQCFVLKGAAEMYDSMTGAATQALVPASQYSVEVTRPLNNGKANVKVTPKTQDIYPLDWENPVLPATPGSSSQNWVVVVIDKNQTNYIPSSVYTTDYYSGANNLPAVAGTGATPVVTKKFVPLPVTGDTTKYRDSSYTTNKYLPFGVVLTEKTKDFPVSKTFDGIMIPLTQHIKEGHSASLTFKKDDIKMVGIANRNDPTKNPADNEGYLNNNGALAYVDSFTGKAFNDNADKEFLYTLDSTGTNILVVANPKHANYNNAVAMRWYNGLAATTGGFPAGSAANYRNVLVTYLVPKGNAAYKLADYSANATLKADIVDRNGINVFVICDNTDDKPYVSVATESTYFDSEDGYSIALFDGYNNDRFFTEAGQTFNYTGERIYRSNDSNLAYSIGGGNVSSSEKMIKALRFFDLDTSFNTTYRVKDETFEAKGAAAKYSEDIKGQFSYGTVEIWPDQVDEATNEGDIDDGEEEPPADNGDEGDNGEEPPVPDDNDPVPPAPPVTGDSSGNIAIALIASALIATAGLVIVMKKARD